MDNQKFPNIFKKSKVGLKFIILIIVAILIVKGLLVYDRRIKVDIGTMEKESWGVMGK